MMSDEENSLYVFIEEYRNYLITSFEDIWSKIKVEPDKLEAYSVIGALLSRQVTLSLEMANSPNILNGHSAPLFLRAITDVHITASWILLDLEERAKKYIIHGLGEEKLLLEYYKKELEDKPDDPHKEEIQKMIDIKSIWINSQRGEWAVEVNFGHWAQLDTRKMAQEADCEGMYKFSYKPFSQAAHNMWSHTSIYNSIQCKNPLHQYHLVPALLETPLDVDFLYRSCKYVHRLYENYNKRFNVVMDLPMPLDWWDSYFENINAEDDSGDA